MEHGNKSGPKSRERKPSKKELHSGTFPDERHSSRQVLTESRCGAKQFTISWADQQESRMPESKVGSTCWVGSWCFSFRRPLNQTSAERSWAPDRMRQVKRPRSRRSGVYFQGRNTFEPTQSSQPNQRVTVRPRNSQGQPENWRAPTQKLAGR